MDSIESKLAAHEQWLESAGRTGQSARFGPEIYRTFTDDNRAIDINDDPQVLLENLDLSGRVLREASFERAIVVHSDLRGTDLSRCNLRRARFEDCDFSGAVLAGTDLSEAIVLGGTFEQVDLRGTRMDDAQIQWTDLSGVDLSGASAVGAKFDFCLAGKVDFGHLRLERTSFRSCDLEGAIFRRCSLSDSDFQDADLLRCDFSFAQLTGASLRHSFAARAVFSGADLSLCNAESCTLDDAVAESTSFERSALRGASLKRADLRYSVLRGADLSNCNLTDATLVGADVSTAYYREVGEADRFGRPSERLKHRTTALDGATWAGARVSLMRADAAALNQLPHDVLERMVKGEGMATSKLKGNGEQVFIAHAHEDQATAERIYHRMRAAGFKPWMDKLDLFAGDPWEIEIPRALRSSDYALVLLSTVSVSKRGYLQREFKIARDLLDEMPEGTVFVVPVRLEEVAVPESFRKFQWVDFFAADGLDRLIEGLVRQSKLQRSRKPRV